MRVLCGQKGQRIPPTRSQPLSFVEHLPIQDFEPWPRHSAPENGWVGSESRQGICLLKRPLAQLGSLEQNARWRVVVSFAGWSGSSGWTGWRDWRGWRMLFQVGLVFWDAVGLRFKSGWFVESWAVYDVDDQSRCRWSKGWLVWKRRSENNMYPLVNQSLLSGKYTI